MEETIDTLLIWARVATAEAPEIPLLDSRDLPDLDLGFFPGERKSLIEDCQGLLATSAGDVPARFAALAVLYRLLLLLRLEPEELLTDDEITPEAVQERLREAVGLVEPESLDVRQLRWEVTNACAAGLWEMAESLLKRLEMRGDCDASTSRLLLGQLQFLRLWLPRLAQQDEDEDSSPWPLDIWRARLVRSEEPYDLLYLLWSVVPVSGKLTPGELSIARDAAHNLGQGLRGESAAGAPYHAALALCAFLGAEYATAAGEYERLATDASVRAIDQALCRDVEDLVDEKYPAGVTLQAQLWERAGIASELGGDIEGARRRLEKAVALNPRARAAWLRLVAAHVKAVEHEKALSVLQDAVEQIPEMEDDPATATALAIGGLQHRSLGLVVRKTRETRILIKALRVHWGAFSWLSAESQEVWAAAVEVLSRKHPQLRAAAVSYVCKVLEEELRLRLFEPFRLEASREVAAAKGQARMAHGAERKEPLEEYALGLRPLTLGEMIRAVAPDRQPKRVEKLFQESLQLVSPGLPERLKQQQLALMRIAAARNTVSHGVTPVSREEALRLYRSVCDIISLLPPPRQSGVKDTAAH